MNLWIYEIEWYDIIDIHFCYWYIGPIRNEYDTDFMNFSSQKFDSICICNENTSKFVSKSFVYRNISYIKITEPKNIEIMQLKETKWFSTKKLYTHRNENGEINHIQSYRSHEIHHFTVNKWHEVTNLSCMRVWYETNKGIRPVCCYQQAAIKTYMRRFLAISFSWSPPTL